MNECLSYVLAGMFSLDSPNLLVILGSLKERRLLDGYTKYFRQRKDSKARKQQQ